MCFLKIFFRESWKGDTNSEIFQIHTFVACVLFLGIYHFTFRSPFDQTLSPQCAKNVISGGIALAVGMGYDFAMMRKCWARTFLLFCGMLILTACTSVASMPLQPEAPEVLLVSVTPLDATMFEQHLRVDLRVRNPNDFALEVTGLDFTLHLNDQRLARGLTNKTSTVPRLGDSVISVETTTSTVDLIRQLLNLPKRQEITYEIKGVLHMQDGRLPFDHKGVLIDTETFAAPSTGS
jgi:LEA14-like dessication related protein